ncbi:MAG: hypothetical protein ACT4PK_06765 [Gammaproteobacteria bacterium]
MSSSTANPEQPPPAVAGPMVLALSFPFLSHFAAILGWPLLQWAALVVICALPQYGGLRAGRWRNWLLLLALAAALLLLTRSGGGIYALFVPPVALPAMVAAFFIGSLRAGRVPLVTRFAAVERGTLSPELLAYTRNVTLAWAWLASALAVAAAALALFAPLWAWSVFTNFVCYALLGLMFAGEYAWRRLRFRHEPHAGFIAFIRSLARTGYRAT